MENDERMQRIEDNADTLLGMQAGMVAVLQAMVMTHPRYDDFQLAATGALELMLGSAACPLSDAQKETARTVAEQIQHTNALKPGTAQLWLKQQMGRPGGATR